MPLSVAQEMELAAAFNVALPVPRLSQAEQKSVLQQLGAFSGPEVGGFGQGMGTEEGRQCKCLGCRGSPRRAHRTDSAHQPHRRLIAPGARHL